MELIIKPTERCNFRCTFCSSTDISSSPKNVLDPAKIFEFLQRFPETRSLIVNGGDPLMVPPSYYWRILEHIESRGLQTSLSFTSNLWIFYRNPEAWTELFRHPKVGVTTSFHYGESRRISEREVFTEDKFWGVSDLFLEKVGYRPGFISVITEENLDRAIDNVHLARRMDVECKLNYALASGAQGRPLLKARVYEVYLEIIRLGLERWEYNTKQLLAKQGRQATTCPLNRSCDESIRCLQPDGDYYSCGAFGDDREHAIDFAAEMSSEEIHRPLQAHPGISFLKQDCLTCPLFEICNGCKKTISDLKRLDLVAGHCAEMQKLLPRLQPYLS